MKITLPTLRSEKENEKLLRAAIARSIEFSEKLDEEREYLVQRAPNIIEWIARPEYLNMPSIYRFSGAYGLIKEFFELRCPDCNKGPKSVPRLPWDPGRPETCLSREVLESEVLLRWSSKYEDDVCPKCSSTRGEFIDRGEFRNYRILHAIIGQRAGKSSTLAMIATYVEHVMLTIAHGYTGGLHKYLGIAPNDPLHMTFVASTDTQSKDTIWAKYRGYRSHSPWFRRYVPWIEGQAKHQDTPKGMQRWEYSEADKSIKNECIKLTIDSLNSNSNGLAGRTRVFAGIDEICRMEQTESARSAQEVYRTMIASCQTVQTRVERYGLVQCLGMLGSISSPISTEDYGMQLLRMSTEDPRMYALRAATWDFNPEEPKKAYEDLLKKDRVGTMRNFGAQPPDAANPLVDRPEEFKKFAIAQGLSPSAVFSTYNFIDQTGVSMLGVRLDEAKLILSGAPRFIAVDAGKNFDAFSVACAHAESDENGNLITEYDWIIRLLTRDRAQEVYFESIYQLLRELTKYYTIGQIEFDHWNSTSIVQRIRNELGLWAEEATTDDEHFIQFVRDCYSSKVRLLPPVSDDDSKDPPYKTAAAAGIYELLHLERDPKTDRIGNPRKGIRRGYDSDDTARVIVHVHRLVQDQGYTEHQDDTSRRARRKRAEVSMSEWSASGRGQIFRVPGGNQPRPSPIVTSKRGW